MGYYQAATNAQLCNACEPGKYQDEDGQPFCANSPSNANYDPIANKCMCNKGYYMEKWCMQTLSCQQ